MPTQLWAQDNFSKGELTPYLYGRAQIGQYYEALKTAQNVLTYPTGAAGKRFGTYFQSILLGGGTPITAFNQIFFQTFQWLDHCTFQLVFSPGNIAVFLEGLLVQDVTTTYDAADVYNLDYTVLVDVFRVTVAGFKPKDLRVTTSGIGNDIDVVNTNSLTMVLPVGSVLVNPVRFTTTGTLPTTTPQIKPDVVYFSRRTGTFTIELYTNAYDAKFAQNKILITAATGTPTSTMLTYDSWSFTDTVFRNRPFYDFTGGYDAINFTPGALTGNTTLTASSAIFTTAHVGGAFFGNGGAARITAFTSSTVVDISIRTPFVSAGAIRGIISFLAEPAWSDLRGWPTKCGSYQSRALFANTISLPNGFWGSVVGGYNNFGNLTLDDDDAISWLPTSNEVNNIRFIVPFRSLTVHTNSGIYSTPLSDTNAITPTTFTLLLQDSTPPDVLQPEAIDNQIIVISGNDVHSMIWDGINNAYNSDIISIINEQVIRDPVDEAAFADLARAGSRYVMIINANGSLAVYQTLISQNVSGFTPHIMEQSYGHAKFLQVASSKDGRCWFIVERQIANAQTPINITAFTSSTLTAVASNISTTIPTAVTFTTSGSLPATTPALALLTNYWALGITADTFKVYASQADALADENSFVFTSAGVNSQVVRYPLVTRFILEELTQDVHLDCALFYNSTAVSSVPTGVIYNAQEVKMVGDGFGFDAIGVNNQVEFVAHGSPVDVSVAYIGFPINTIMEPMPISPPPNQMTSLTKPTHIRTVRFMFNNTIGGAINGVPIAIKPFDQSDIGQPPIPARGIFEMSLLGGWDDFNKPSFTIEHNEPFNIELIGVFYSVDI